MPGHPSFWKLEPEIFQSVDYLFYGGWRAYVHCIYSSANLQTFFDMKVTRGTSYFPLEMFIKTWASFSWQELCISSPVHKSLNSGRWLVNRSCDLASKSLNIEEELVWAKIIHLPNRTNLRFLNWKEKETKYSVRIMMLCYKIWRNKQILLQTPVFIWNSIKILGELICFFNNWKFKLSFRL